MSQIVSLARSAAALTATAALVSPAAALAHSGSLIPKFGHLPSLSSAPPVGLVQSGSTTTADAQTGIGGDGLPTTGADVIPEALLGAAILAAGAGLRAAGAGERR